jgi:hypothetical protein
LSPGMGRGSTHPSTKASGPPAVEASGTAAVDVLGLSSDKVAGTRSPTSATTAALSSWPRTGRAAGTTGSGASAIPTSAATGGSSDEPATAPAGVDADTNNKSVGLEVAAASAASPGMMATATKGSTWGTHPMSTRAAWAPRSSALCAEASQPAWRAAAPAAEASLVLRAFLGARPVEPCLRLLKERARSRHTEKKPKQRYPRILTRSGPGSIVPAGRPFGPRSSQALPRVAPLLTLAPPLPRAPEAPKGRPAQASSRRPEDQLPVQPTRAPALRGQVDRPDSPESPRLPRPRGQVPPRPASAPRTGTLMSRPQILMAPAHLEAGSATPGPASDPG